MAEGPDVPPRIPLVVGTASDVVTALDDDGEWTAAVVWRYPDCVVGSYSKVVGVGLSGARWSGPRVVGKFSVLAATGPALFVLLSVPSSWSTEMPASVVVVSHVSPESSSVVTSSGKNVVVAGGGSAVGTSWHSGPSLTSSMATPPSPGCRVRAAKTN